MNKGHIGTTNSFAVRRRDDIIATLTFAKSLWKKNADQSAEAQRAVKAITIVLQHNFDISNTNFDRFRW